MLTRTHERRPGRRTTRSRRELPGTTLRVAIGLALVLATGMSACDSPRKRAREVEPVVRDVPSVLRGTIGAECSIRGNEPILVSGLGLVVGLNGTGGGPLPVQIQATMERELARGGIGKGGPLADGPLAGKTPREVLRDPNVAVVLVEGVVPPGSPKGATFDVRVRALPGSTVTSLEGGTLWTTTLRVGPMTPFGGVKARNIGEAKGSVFINPFADPAGGATTVAALSAGAAAADASADPSAKPAPAPRGDDNGRRAEGSTLARDSAGPAGKTSASATADEASSGGLTPASISRVGLGDGITRTVGRVLAGGMVTEPFAMELVLDNPSHARAISITQAINSRFPPGREDDGNTARGRNNASIAVRVPRAYRESTEEFLQLLKFTQIDQAFPQEYARRFAEELKRSPALSDELSWSLQALGKSATPFLTSLYDDAEFLPRLAALRAGARLGDPRATPFLRQMARTGPVSLRAEVAELLGQMEGDPQINLTLRELVERAELDVRVAAYEALAKRGDMLIERSTIAGKFMLDVVPVGEDLIYVSQQGRPKIVLFGSGMRLAPDALVTSWSNRLMITADDKPSGDTATSVASAVPPPSGPSSARLYYLDYRTGRATQSRVGLQVREIVRYLARRPTPEDPDPGLDLTYSEVVGALYEMQKQGAIGTRQPSVALATPQPTAPAPAGAAAFATERDRLLARLLEAQNATTVEERPESGDVAPDRLTSMMRLPTKQAEGAPAPAPGREPRSYVVPLSGPKKN